MAIPKLDVVVKEEAMEEVEEEEPAAWNPTLVGQRWSWTETVPCTPEQVRANAWSPSPPRARDRASAAACPPLDAVGLSLTTRTTAAATER